MQPTKQACVYRWKNPKKTGRGNYIVCANCNNSRITMIDDLSRCRRRCGNPGPVPKWKPRTRLGDMTAKALASVGITKHRYRRAMVYLRLLDPSKACGCDARQAKLNRIGDGVVRWWQKLVARIAAYRLRITKRSDK